MGSVHFLHAEPAQPWRVEALMTMSPDQIGQAFGGDDNAGWLEAATVCGLVEAQMKLGRMLLTGEGIAADRRAAFACFLSASGGGSAEACNLMGRCYENGWGIAVNRQAARSCYRRAAVAGDYRGAHNYACTLAHDGCIAGALRWFERGIADAPTPARAQMLHALSHHPRCAVRAFALKQLENRPVAPMGHSA